MSFNEHRSNASPAVEGSQASDIAGSVTAGPDQRPTTDFHPDPPSETVAPTQVSTPPQQAATQPELGGVQQSVVIQPSKPSFNQQVVGYAKEIRGTILRKHDTKDYGGKIRKGEEPWPPVSQDNDSQTTSPTSLSPDATPPSQ